VRRRIFHAAVKCAKDGNGPYNFADLDGNIQKAKVSQKYEDW
jgi:hypothetical protein